MMNIGNVYVLGLVCSLLYYSALWTMTYSLFSQEIVTAQKKKQTVEEQVMIDNLSR